MEMEFGGISEKCFVEISFGEEDSYKVFIINSLQARINLLINAKNFKLKIFRDLVQTQISDKKVQSAIMSRFENLLFFQARPLSP